jgi:hypothetical protein
MDPTPMTTPTDPWTVIALAVEQALPEQCPRFIGELERLKASLWMKMTGPTQKHAVSEQDCLLTADDVALRLKVSKAYVYKNAAQYPFSVREGRYIRFSQNGLARYIEKHQRK